VRHPSRLVWEWLRHGLLVGLRLIPRPRVAEATTGLSSLLYNFLMQFGQSHPWRSLINRIIILFNLSELERDLFGVYPLNLARKLD